MSTSELRESLVNVSRVLLDMLRQQEKIDFRDIIPGDEL
jgi:hypothetical protein